MDLLRFEFDFGFGLQQVRSCPIADDLSFSYDADESITARSNVIYKENTDHDLA